MRASTARAVLVRSGPTRGPAGRTTPRQEPLWTEPRTQGPACDHGQRGQGGDWVRAGPEKMRSGLIILFFKLGWGSPICLPLEYPGSGSICY